MVRGRRIRGLSTEVVVGRPDGLDHDGVVSCDNVTTVAADHLLAQIGFLLPDQEELLTGAIVAAFDLD